MRLSLPGSGGWSGGRECGERDRAAQPGEARWAAGQRLEGPRRKQIGPEFLWIACRLSAALDDTGRHDLLL